MSAWRSLVEFSIRHPRLILVLTLVLTAGFAAQLPKMRADTDPKNMLPVTSPVRQYNDQVEGWFGLHADVIVLGIRRDDGIFAPDTLARICRITEDILKLPGVVARDVIGFATLDDVTVAGDTVRAVRLLANSPRTPEEAEAFRRRVFDNPLLPNRLISPDGKTTAIYVPLERGANGKAVADSITAIVAKQGGPERFYLAGDPVARDTFGAEMFKQMGLFSPIAGMVMTVVLFLMFRNWTLVVANMAVAMLSIIWAMGLFIGLGIPIHIMASMSPVFLMAISTDTVHIFNEFGFRFRELGRKDDAIRQTMAAVATPVLYSDLTTAAGFASLAIGPIIPVRVFGLLVAFGTLVILLMSFTLVPAIMALMREKRLARFQAHDIEATAGPRWLTALGRLGLARRKAVVLVGLLLLLLAAVGIRQIRVNNNMVEWFKPNSGIRQADRVLNDGLGGTATLYLVAAAAQEEAIKDPNLLRAMEGLQRRLATHEVVGKTLSVADYVKRVNRVLHDNDLKQDVIPDDKDVVGQYLLLFNMAVKPRDLDNVVDYPFQKANIFVQLKSWDAVETRALLQDVQQYLTANPLPGAEIKPAGIAYFNMVWNDEVLVGMLEGFLLSCILVLFLLVLDYRSLKWGIVSFMPLLFTIVLIYGIVGFVGKDFDMPISVLSTLSLGMAIDFAIHFVSRFQQRFREGRDLTEVLLWTVARPGRGIVRNAVLFASGFAVMVFARLTPYITMGIFMMAIMLLSALATLIYLPALIALFPGWLLKAPNEVRG
jgi:predicted RND superfamily exporter protein